MSMPLSVLSLSVVLSCTITLTNAVLQSYRKVYIPIISMGIGCIVKLVLSYALISMPSINILGAPISTLACDAVICIINVYCMKKALHQSIGVIKILSKPLICSALSVGLAYGVKILMYKSFEDSRLLTLACIGMAGIIYLLLAGKEILKLKN